MNKYRAWDKENKKIYKVSTIHIEDEYVSLFEKIIYEGEFTRKFNEIILMQSTGLKDKNGVESWEGNYLTREGYPSYVIERVEEYGCLMAVSVDPIQKLNWKPEMVKNLLAFGFINDGNIHANPELFKEIAD